MSTSVALIGATGHGNWHRRAIAALGDRVRLVALGDVRPVEDADVPVYADHRELLDRHAPEVVVVCTPPHTHLPIARDVLAAGADLLLEKPPVLSLDEHRALLAAVSASGRALQVGFQALGSPVLAALPDLVGTVTSVALAGAWWRGDAYWKRSPWAGRSSVGGRPTMDGALCNPLAHGLMQALAIAGVRPPWTLELERFRTRDIEVEDTAALRLTGPGGPVVTAAVTLCSGEFVPGDLTVTGTAGTATVVYPQDRLDGDVLPGRVGLLENLLDHRADGTPLLVPLERTEPFTALAAAIMAAPTPELLPRERLAPHPDGDGLVIPGIAHHVRAAAARGALFSEIGALR
ncbi:Gfo/Idh/MocA family oxidoreductase [Dactylosporangium sp. NPDC005572]|uniref:Gfo/Idh/MocA family protein n=1 Tax=Dactylosporangium sp. NPDC005572 TaxID=3156889 RepID=UPI0033AE2582